MGNHKGKNFSLNNMGQRKKSDFYQTPYSLTGKLLDYIDTKQLGLVLEPSSGEGAICKVLDDRGIKYEHYDLAHGVNFFDETRTFDTVLTNPPYSAANLFIHKAQSVAKKNIFLLLPLSYLHGKSRHDQIYKKYLNLKTVLVFTRYPMLSDKIREDGKYETGMMVYAWYLFDKDYSGLPTIDWLDNNEDVVRKGIAG